MLILSPAACPEAFIHHLFPRCRGIEIVIHPFHVPLQFIDLLLYFFVPALFKKDLQLPGLQIEPATGAVKIVPACFEESPFPSLGGFEDLHFLVHLQIDPFSDFPGIIGHFVPSTRFLSSEIVFDI